MNKNKVLTDLMDLVRANQSLILAANQRDRELAIQLDATLVDRLKVDAKKVEGMIGSIREVIDLPDPEDQLLSTYQHPNGMLVENRVVPFGNILIIYESRPDVTIEAAVSAFKAGNKIFLKGGKEAKYTNLALVDLWHQALEKNDLPKDFVVYLDIDRTESQRMIRENPYRLDLIIPRGGEGLIRFIQQNTEVPILVSGRGNNFMYVHTDADLNMTTELIINGKSRLSVCNALDKVIFNQHIVGLSDYLDRLNQQLLDHKLIVHTYQLPYTLAKAKVVTEKDILYREFLSADILLTTVDTPAQAMEMINEYSGGHSAVIVTKDNAVAKTFQKQVDCAAVYHNASTRFTDGGQFGFGAEIAISTQKLHFRGPVGLAQLVTNKWFISGNGQTRS